MNREKKINRIKEDIKKLEYMLDNYQLNEEMKILFKNILFNEKKFLKEEYNVSSENNEECYFRYGDALSPKKLVDILKGSEE